MIFTSSYIILFFKLCSIILLYVSCPKCFLSFVCLSVLQACCPECGEVHTEGELYLVSPMFDFPKPVTKDMGLPGHPRPQTITSLIVFLLLKYPNTSCLISVSTVQTRIQSPWVVRHRLNCQTVTTPVWHGEGCFCPTLQQKYHCNIPAPLPLPFR